MSHLFFPKASVSIRVVAFGLLLLLAFTASAHAGQVTLAWDANTDPELGGYKLYYGPTSGNYTGNVDVGNQTTSTLTGLTAGQTYYFAVKAYDLLRQNESAFSNAVQATIPISTAAPVAAFSATPTTGAAALNVTFTDSSTGSVTAWSWNFGDGTTSTSKNPSHTYSASGAYSVSLTVTGSGGSNSITKTKYINVAAPVLILTNSPVAGFSASPTTGTAPLNVNFTDASSGSITAWNWSFGDGTTSTAKNPSHTYSASGSYSVSLTVTGPGGSKTLTKTNYITAVAPAPVASFTATPTTGTAALNVAFTDTSSGSVTAWNWNFGDGTSSTTRNPSHTYSASGTYTVSLTVTGSGGSNTAIKINYVNVAAPSLASGSTITTYEDAEDGTISGWSISDNWPRGAKISNVYDSDRNSRVIQLTGSGIQNGYQLRNPGGTKWGNSSQFIVQWSMNYSEDFLVSIDVKTTAGQRYLSYQPVNQNSLGKKQSVYHGLGTAVIDGQWHTFVRDLQADLADAQPGVRILQVNGFLIRGSGRVDDIKLLSLTTYEDAEDGTISGWSIYDDPSGGSNDQQCIR